jgi:EAL domain-containing protein (putative c-di-GMP-specific phosphodiesterase class I)
MRTLFELKSIGIKLAIDDFGTGYSSLSYLKRLPIDCLKIDRSFINDLGRDGEGVAIVQAIISMAKSLGLSITAEGIETTEQTRFLLYQHCNFGQGYLFSRPIDAENLSLLLNAADLPGVGERAA